MIENIIAAVIVFAAMGFVLWGLSRRASGGRPGCGPCCGCGMTCEQPPRPPDRPPHDSRPE